MKELFTALGIDPAGIAAAGQHDLENLKKLRRHHPEGSAMRTALERDIEANEQMIKTLGSMEE